MSGDVECIVVYGDEKATALVDGEWVDYETAEMVRRKYARGEIGDEELEERLEEAVAEPGTPVERAKSACHALQLRSQLEDDPRTSAGDDS